MEFPGRQCGKPGVELLHSHAHCLIRVCSLAGIVSDFNCSRNDLAANCTKLKTADVVPIIDAGSIASKVSRIYTSRSWIVDPSGLFGKLLIF